MNYRCISGNYRFPGGWRRDPGEMSPTEKSTGESVSLLRSRVREVVRETQGFSDVKNMLSVVSPTPKTGVLFVFRYRGPIPTLIGCPNAPISALISPT
jgi:hypothetical protein